METQTELFSITCTSCAAKLKVRQESAIGQVLSCPRCQSMVMVEPPDDWSGSSQSQESSNDAVQHQATNEAAVVPTGDWNTNQSKQRQKLLLLITCGALVLLGIGAAVVVMLTQFGENSASAKSDDSEDRSEQESKNDTQDQTNPFVVAQKQDNVENNDSQKPGTTEVNDGANSNELNSADLKNATGSNGSDQNDAQATNETGDGSGTVAQDPDSNKNDQQSPSNDTGKDSTNDEQKGDPEPFELDKPTNEKADTITGPDSLLQSFTDSKVPIFGPDDPVITGDPDNTSVNEEIGIGTIYVPYPDPLDGDVAEKLDITLTGIKFDAISVLEFVQFMAKMAEIPICFNIDAIRAEGIDLNQKLDVLTEQATVREILESNLSPIGLVLEVSDKVVVLSTAKQSNYSFVDYQFPLAIDTNNQEEVKRYTGNLQSAINPESWSTSGGKGLLEVKDGKLQIFQIPSTHQKIANFISRLDLSKQLMDSPGNEELLEKSKSKYLNVQKHMGRLVALEVVDPKPISEVFEKLGAELGITILIDWQSLMTEHWNPDTLVPWANSKKTFGQSLNELMSSMKTGYRWIDDNTLEITTRKKVYEAIEIEVYSIKNLQGKNRTHQHILLLVENNIAPIMPRDNPSSLVYEPKCDAIVALMPQTVHKLLQKLLLDIAKRPAE